MRSIAHFSECIFMSFSRRLYIFTAVFQIYWVVEKKNDEWTNITHSYSHSCSTAYILTPADVSLCIPPLPSSPFLSHSLQHIYYLLFSPSSSVLHCSQLSGWLLVGGSCRQVCTHSVSLITNSGRSKVIRQRLIYYNDILCQQQSVSPPGRAAEGVILVTVKAVSAFH